MWFEVGSRIVVRNAEQRLIDWCNDNLVLANPEYIKKERMGKWTGNTPRNIYLYEKNGSDLILPFGCINDLRSLYPQCRFLSRIKPSDAFKYGSDIKLYSYQENAVNEALRARNGVIVMPCGAGKTQTALEIIARLERKALWLTHTQDLLNQSLNRAKSVLSCPVSSYGTITGGKVQIGSGITFATVQTMSKLDLAQYRDVWDVVIVDECHKAVGSPTKVMQFYKVLSSLACRYKYGVTATPKRADGLHKSMLALIGGVVYEVHRNEIRNTTCSVVVQKIETGYMPDMNVVLAGDGTLNYAGLVDDMIHDADRLKCVSDVLNTLDGSALVLANRVEYLKDLKAAVSKKSVCLSAIGNSKAAKATRKEALRKLNDGEIDCIFATYALAREGLDVPNLRYVVFATPEKDPTTIEQSTGRVGRKADGKSYGTVIDFVDNFGMYRGWSKKRNGFYKKLEYDVQETIDMT